jgi:hypothetical protein
LIHNKPRETVKLGAVYKGVNRETGEIREQSRHLDSVGVVVRVGNLAHLVSTWMRKEERSW